VRVFQAADFVSLINGTAAGDFLVQARYEIGPAFERALGIAYLRAAHTLSYQRVIPDMIAVRAAEAFATRIDPAGDVHFLPVGDQRLQLQVIDIKLTAEPSPGYFSEIAYYSMVLAGWLIDNGLDHQFVVVLDGAVWPGSHDLSALTQCVQEATAAGTIPTDADLAQALGSELELIPFEVFAYRVRRFLQIELPDVLGRPWQTLPWHVDNRCKGCEYLGHPWINQAGQQTAQPEHCIPEAERIGQLSRVDFISRGARNVLEANGVADVQTLAGHVPSAPVFDHHQSLRTGRAVISGRAISLANNLPAIPPDTVRRQSCRDGRICESTLLATLILAAP
jgi:hypothetical protein